MNYPKFKIFLGCVPGTAKENDLLQLFSSLGDIKEISLRYRKSDGKCAGFGYLICSDSSTYQRILQTKNFNFKGRKIICSKFLKDNKSKVKAKNSLKKRKLLIKNISGDVDQDELTKFFENFGKVEIAYIVQHEANMKKKANQGTEIVHNQGCVIFKEERDAEMMLRQEKVFLRGKELKLKLTGQKKKKQNSQSINSSAKFEANNQSYKLDQQASTHVYIKNGMAHSMNYFSNQHSAYENSIIHQYEHQLDSSNRIGKSIVQGVQVNTEWYPHYPAYGSLGVSPNAGLSNPYNGGSSKNDVERFLKKPAPYIQNQESFQNPILRKPDEASALLDPRSGILNSKNRWNHCYKDFSASNSARQQRNYPQSQSSSQLGSCPKSVSQGFRQSYISDRELQGGTGFQGNQLGGREAASLTMLNNEKLYHKNRGLEREACPKISMTDIVSLVEEPLYGQKNEAPYFCQKYALCRSTSATLQVSSNHKASNLRLNWGRLRPKKNLDSVKGDKKLLSQN